MGLSRNKVAVSEGAAGSPPFYGDHEVLSRGLRSRLTSEVLSEAGTELLLFNFQGSETGRPERIIEKEQTRRYGGVAQLGEHLPCKQGVMGSNPIISTTRQCRDPKREKMERTSYQLSEENGL